MNEKYAKPISQSFLINNNIIVFTSNKQNLKTCKELRSHHNNYVIPYPTNNAQSFRSLTASTKPQCGKDKGIKFYIIPFSSMQVIHNNQKMAYFREMFGHA